MDDLSAEQQAPQKGDRYKDINKGWPENIPPLTRIEAERARKRLTRHFGFRAYEVRRCWIAISPPYHLLDRGWRRLVHDLSHDWFQQTYPRKRAHDPLHARYEAEMVAFVLESGWLDGSLKPKQKAKPTAHEKKSRELTKTLASIKRWQTKAKRAQTALKKLEKRRKYYEAKLAA